MHGALGNRDIGARGRGRDNRSQIMQDLIGLRKDSGFAANGNGRI